MASRKIEVKIIGDASSLQRAFGTAGRSAGGFGNSMMKVGKVAAIGLAALGAGAAVAGKRMIEMASDAAEVQSKMEVVFGKALPALTKNIDKFSAATGTSRFAMREQVADMGALLVPLTANKKAAANMSLQFTKLATDLGSFNNVPTAEALLAIRSGLVGEAEPLRRFGVLLNEAAVKQEALRLGLIKGKEELTEQEKVQARASLIMQQTTLAQGDATRTAGSMANQMKALRTNVEDAATSIGMALIPHALRAVQAFNQHWPEIERIAKKVFATIATVIDALKPVFAALVSGIQFIARAAQTYWPHVQEAAAKVVAWYRGTLQPAIENVIRAVTAIWQRFGGDITRIAMMAFNTARTVVVAAMRVIQGVIEGVLALIRGDWSQAWNSLKMVVSNVFIGIRAIIVGFHKIAFAAMVVVGRALIDGVIAGASGLGSRLKDALASQISGAVSGVKGVFGIGSPSKVLAEQVGKPLAEGVILGWVIGSAALPEKMKESVQKAIEAARAAVERSRGALANAFSGVASDALSAFDAIQGQILTRSEKLLAKLRGQREAAARTGAVTEARGALAGAMLGDAEGNVDPAAVASAQKQLDDALWAQREFGLQQRAEQERRELDAKTAMRRRDLENALATLGEKMGKEGAKAATASEAVLKLLGKYGVNFKAVGASMGQAWIAGLKETIAAAAAGSGALAGTIGSVSAGIAGGTGASSTQVTQLILDGKIVAEAVRKEDRVYQRANG